MENLTFIVTGSSGWISSSFLSEIKLNHKNANLILIPNLQEWEKIESNIFSEKQNIYLIHNAFSSHTQLSSISEEEYINNLDSNFIQTKAFISRNRIKGMFYPSSGSVYKLREVDNNQYKIYSDQKKFEEEEFKKLSENYNFKLVMPRIFSVIGSGYSKLNNSSFISILNEAIEDGEINLKSKTNNLHSICILENLVNLSLNYLVKKNNENFLFFDAVDETLSLYDFCIEVLEAVNKDERSLIYDFNNDLGKQDYVGDKELYLNYLKIYNKEYIGIKKILKDIVEN